MSRIIKFRVYDNLKKEFLTNLFYGGTPIFSLNLKHELDWIKDTFDGQPQEEFIFQQFTGLYDKNGTEIFEGDVIECGFRPTESLNSLRKKPIYYYHGGFYYDGDAISKYVIIEKTLKIPNFKVVGNIFEYNK